MAKLNGVAVGCVAAGGLLTFAGLKGKSVLGSVKSLIQGQSPATAPSANAIANTGASTSSASSGPASLPPQSSPASSTDSANQALGRLLAASYGWSAGENWQALNYGWGTLESGWNATISNGQGSGAFGIAQALGHGNSQTQGTLSNAYGPVYNMSFPNSLYVGANSGNPADQIRWGLFYIKARYGSPSQVPGWLGQPGYNGY